MLAIVMMWFAAGAVDSYSQYRMDWLADTACRGITPGMSVTEARATLQELGLSLVSPILEPDPLHVRFPQQPYFLAMIHGGFQFNIVTRDVQVIITLDPAAQHVQSITRRDVLTGP